MQITISVDMGEVDAMLKKMQSASQSAAKPLADGAHIVEKHAKLNIKGHGLWKSGQLFNSLKVQEAGAWHALVGTSGVIYAAIHEFGGVITPKRAKYLSWIGPTGERVFAKRVRMPAKPYLRPAFDENKEEIKGVIAAGIKKMIGA